MLRAGANSDQITSFDTTSIISDWALFLKTDNECLSRLCVTRKEFLPADAVRDSVGIWNLRPDYSELCLRSDGSGYTVYPPFDAPHIDLLCPEAEALILHPPDEEWMPLSSALSEMFCHFEMEVLLVENDAIYGELLRLNNNRKITLKEIDWQSGFGMIVRVPGIIVRDIWKVFAEWRFTTKSKIPVKAFANLCNAIERGQELEIQKVDKVELKTHEFIKQDRKASIDTVSMKNAIEQLQKQVGGANSLSDGAARGRIMRAIGANLIEASQSPNGRYTLAKRSLSAYLFEQKPKKR